MACAVQFESRLLLAALDASQRKLDELSAVSGALLPLPGADGVLVVLPEESEVGDECPESPPKVSAVE